MRRRERFPKKITRLRKKISKNVFEMFLEGGSGRNPPARQLSQLFDSTGGGVGWGGGPRTQVICLVSNEVIQKIISMSESKHSYYLRTYTNFKMKLHRENSPKYHVNTRCQISWDFIEKNVWNKFSLTTVVGVKLVTPWFITKLFSPCFSSSSSLLLSSPDFLIFFPPIQEVCVR